MKAGQPNSVTGLPYSLVDIDAPKLPLVKRVQEADALQWKLWLQRYAWFLSLLTMAPGIALIAYTATRELPFSVGITALAVGAPAGVFWWRTRQLP
jgi:hypothetical protein